VKLATDGTNPQTHIHARNVALLEKRLNAFVLVEMSTCATKTSMKLYATVTSERASKGQGGNKWLDIDVFTGSSDKSEHQIRISVREDAITIDGHAMKGRIETILLKGEKQKGEIVSRDDYYGPLA